MHFFVLFRAILYFEFTTHVVLGAILDKFLDFSILDESEFVNAKLSFLA